MLTKLEVRNPQGQLLSLPLLDYSNGYTIENIDGLDPVKATLVYSDFAGQDLSTFQSARRDRRNIVLQVGFEPNYALTNVLTLRRNLYKWFMPKTPLQLRFYEDDGLTVNISGRVESNDSPRFTKDPDGTFSIICEDSNFVDLTARTYSGMTTAGTTTTDGVYNGSIETGFLFTLNVDRTISGFTLYNTPADNTQRSLIFNTPMVAGDVLKISTIPGNKYAILTHGGVDSSVLYGVSPASNWLNLFPGTNKIRALVSGAGIPWTIAYTDKYGGL